MLQVAVVKFLIKHFSRIFEEAVTSPMDENAINLHSSSKTSGNLLHLADFGNEVTLICPSKNKLNTDFPHE